jgi:outer membrane beta-barrel protein
LLKKSKIHMPANRNLRHSMRRVFTYLLLVALMPAFAAVPLHAQEKFDDYEVRVIRPKYFQKGGRFELGAQFSAIMNETFVYTYMASGLMTFHFNESFAIEAQGSYGFSIDREEKEVLKNQFDIRTQIFRTSYTLEGALLWTPIYGKWQLPSGRLIYFDTFLSAGGGLNGIFWDYKDFCEQTKDVNGLLSSIPTNKTSAYPTFSFGIGQRYFINKSVSVKWDLRNHTIMYNTADTSCDTSGTAQGVADTHNNITMQLGASKFF